jgi:hypothetical protein
MKDTGNTRFFVLAIDEHLGLESLSNSLLDLLTVMLLKERSSQGAIIYLWTLLHFLDRN